MLKTARRLNGRQKRNIVLLLAIPVLIFLLWDAVSEKVLNTAYRQQAYLAAERTAAHVTASREIYDVLKNTSPHYISKNILEGVNVEIFRDYFGPRPSAQHPGAF